MEKVIDGNKACSIVSYKFTEVAGIYPITPASPMAENMDVFASKNETNFFGDKVKIVEMQSEAGAIATVHGLLQNGILASTYTASQGLLLMIPNMYKIAGELLPCVINVAARTVATHALSIMGDHSDVYAARTTGFAILSSSSVQQIMDLTNVSYLSTLKGSIPFINFFDGFRTSHEYNKVKEIDFDKVKELTDQKSLKKFREKSLDINNPTTRGTNQGDKTYFQGLEARNKYYNNLPDIVNNYMKEINKITGQDYKPFNYYGDKKAKKIIVSMGSVSSTIKEYLTYKSKDIGLIEVHLFRPFSEKYFLDVLPKKVKTIAVLDRAKEPGATGEPLYLDVANIIKNNNLDIKVLRGRYGISSKDTNLNDIEAIFNYLNNPDKNEFTIGIEDDVSNLSLEKTNTIFEKKYNEILIYGYGSDGMVTASKDIISIIGDQKDKYVQGYFEYDSRKSGGLTKSHLRIGSQPIDSPYYVTNPKLVICSKESYLKNYELLNNIKENGTFILNTEKEINELEFSSNFIKNLQKKNIKFWTINASKIARKNNIPNKISMIMETVILSLLEDFNEEKALSLVTEKIKNNFSGKGKELVDNNINAIKDALNNLQRQDVKLLNASFDLNINNNIFEIMKSGKAEDLKVSDFVNISDGITKGGMSKFEKKDASSHIPTYDKDKCTGCNLCSLVCPHAVIRPYLLDEEETNNSPKEVKEDLQEFKLDKKLKFTISISPEDCTGCGLCASVCPTGALKMMNNVKNKEKENIKHEYLEKIKEKANYPLNTTMGLGFKKPGFSFPGACPGCAEANYLKILTQLFRENLIIANATGCSSIFGGNFPFTPYNVPWANSLFEDNAEFGYGMRIGEDFMKERIKRIMKENYKDLNKQNKELIDEYLNKYSNEISIKVYNELDYDNFKEIKPLKKYIKQKSIWLTGGDGWAYDIGFGGIDHVLANKENINILVLDTETYSNTGGQSSKATRYGAIAKFASTGKTTMKKNLAKIALTYPHVFVATISLGANYAQTIKTLIEANNYDGPSIVIAYSPCISHGIKNNFNSIEEQRLATESGYFPLFRYNPETDEFKLYSKASYEKLDELFKKENRFNTDKEMLNQTKENIKNTFEDYKNDAK